MDEKSAGVKQAFTINELVDLGYGSRALLYREIAGGSLTAKKIGNKKTIVLATDLQKYLAKLPNVGQKSA